MPEKSPQGPEKALRPLWQCGKGYWGGAEVRCLYGIHIEEGIYETLFEDAGGICLCMGLLASPAQAEKFVVGFQPYDTISYQAIINAELGLWKKYTPEGTEIEFHPLCRGRSRSNMLADRAQIGYMSIMPAAVLCVRAKGKVKMVSTTDMSEGTAARSS